MYICTTYASGDSAWSDDPQSNNRRFLEVPEPMKFLNLALSVHPVAVLGRLGSILQCNCCDFCL
jgi:hypothetical protein